MKTYMIARELVKIAKRSGYKVKIEKEQAIEDGVVYRDQKLVLVGSHRHGIRYPLLKFLATLAHEVGHIKTANDRRDEKSLKSMFGGCNKYVLVNELRASAWAIRFLRKKQVKQMDAVKTYLKKCYNTYRKVYDSSFDSIDVINKVKNRSIITL